MTEKIQKIVERLEKELGSFIYYRDFKDKHGFVLANNESKLCGFSIDNSVLENPDKLEEQLTDIIRQAKNVLNN